MKILLTGGLGYIGSHTAAVLLAGGHELVIVDNLVNAKVEVKDRLESIAQKPIVFIETDVRDTEQLTHTLKHHAIEAVVHFAGLKAVGESVAKPVDYYDNNVTGTISLLKAMQAAAVTQTLVFSSSATVYGEPQYLPLDEAHPTSATNPYGRSKLHIEEMLKDLSFSDPQWRIACLRYFNPVGAHPSGLIGEDPNDTPNNLMPFIARVAAGQLPELQVFGGDYDTVDGTGVRDYIHVMDLAAGHQAALQFLAQERGWHAINLGTGQGFSVLQMIAAFKAASGQSISYKIAARRPGDVASCFAQADKARALLGWTAQRTLEDMCASTWHFQQNQKMGVDPR
ncbi:UDP-galactose 4-epimerase [Ectothiorhodosinus mongolicus]|uniref:UDP-glucose 4-epimerase n=1 Tax=Ectothiorhodosinus mongolicus TaxID=233100 RepID=A0A1R3VR02_9GAMM|nr:UDP-glucose 4-epimerase GalE [Ectothiorhodosinus mongolicus]ULX56740.1 UDP-glucose 4-epimerase GalE [Ectothiorhodosinus mongolicus]SIT67076.1 UDP-galactose 4-epimerase [Ectothiorhodosinus mongolicus]